MADSNTLPLGTILIGGQLAPMAPCPEPVLVSAATGVFAYAAGFAINAATNELTDPALALPLSALPTLPSF